MNHQSNHKLRDRTVVESRTKNTNTNKTPVSKTEYEQEKKWCQQKQENGGVLRKREPKVKYGINAMTAEEKRTYERNWKLPLWLTMKMKEKELIEIEDDEKEELQSEEQQNENTDETIKEEETEEQSENETKISDVDFNFN